MPPRPFHATRALPPRADPDTFAVKRTPRGSRWYGSDSGGAVEGLAGDVGVAGMARGLLGRIATCLAAQAVHQEGNGADRPVPETDNRDWHHEDAQHDGEHAADPVWRKRSG
jgi:hypothetical protein